MAALVGWQWCPGARGHCAACLQYSHGVWKYWLTETTAVMIVCGPCAEKIADAKERRVAA